VTPSPSPLLARERDGVRGKRLESLAKFNSDIFVLIEMNLNSYVRNF